MNDQFAGASGGMGQKVFLFFLDAVLAFGL